MMNRSSKNKLLSVGVDVGSTNGAISVVDEDLHILLLTKAPVYQTISKTKRNKSKLNKETMMYEKDYRKKNWVDFKAVGEMFKDYEGTKNIYTIERITSRPREGEVTSFTNGNSLGIFQGMYSILQPLKYYEPTALEWKSSLGVSSRKETSIALAEDIYQVNLRDYVPKGKVDDVAEALLLSFYGLKRYLTEIGEI